MKKEVLILPLLLLTACAEMTGDAYNDDDLYAEETGLSVEEQTKSDSADIAVVEPKQSQQQEVVQNARISSDGMMIELPAQQIYLDNVRVPTTAPAPQYAPTPAPVLAYSEPMGAQPLPPPPPQPAVVTLQNIAYPNTFAQCAAADVNCIASYEYQGYRRLNGTPQFAGYQDVLSHSDYPQDGRWRNRNNIPRW